MKTPSLSRLLRHDKFPTDDRGEKDLEALQLRMLRIQQGLWHSRRRAIVIFEGFDAAGKGGAIRRLVEDLDPRGFQVHPIGPPTPAELTQHYLQRFWTKLPLPGTIAIFDRSWYGRVLVERVDGIVSQPRLKQAYTEINEFERQLIDDGIDVIKIFLGISGAEQLRRFEERLADPYKSWKLTRADVEARAKWNAYVKAVDQAFERTHSREAPWHLVAADDKAYARGQTLEIVTRGLKGYARWLEGQTQVKRARSLRAALGELEKS